MTANVKVNDNKLNIYSKGRRFPNQIDRYVLEVYANYKDINFNAMTEVYSDTVDKFYLEEQNDFVQCRLVHQGGSSPILDLDDKCSCNAELALKYAGKKIMNVIVNTLNGTNLTYLSMSVDKILEMLPNDYTVIYLEKDATHKGCGFYIVDKFNAYLGEEYVA